MSIFHFGLANSAPWFLMTGFLIIIAGFVGHVIINFTLNTSFTNGETALALFVLFLVLIFVIIYGLFSKQQETLPNFLVMCLGLLGLVVTVFLYLLFKHGPRGAFRKFDVIRDNNLRAASRLPHRGGRR
tara:strand:- start:399 stop:785 length:387 start_codon:yes stop_codon:yes gene_type:complete